MYAILQHGGHQYRVASGDRIVVDRLPAEVGDVIGLTPVLLVADGDRIETRGEGLEGVRVAATVLAHVRGRKLRVFTYKPKKRHRRTLGFRAELTELRVERVLSAGEDLPEPGPAEAGSADGAAPETAEAPAALAPSRGRRRRGAAAAPEPAAAGEAVAEAWGEAEVRPAAEPGPAELAEASTAPAEEPMSAPEAGDEGEARPPRRRPRTSPSTEPSAEEQPPAGSESAPSSRAPRRRVSRRAEPGGKEAE